MDKGGVTGAILTDLAKAFDCILHDLLIAKLTVYGSDYQSLRITDNFLSNSIKEQKLILLLFITLKLYVEFDKAQFWSLPFQYLYL